MGAILLYNNFNESGADGITSLQTKVILLYNRYRLHVLKGNYTKEEKQNIHVFVFRDGEKNVYFSFSLSFVNFHKRTMNFGNQRPKTEPKFSQLEIKFHTSFEFCL